MSSEDPLHKLPLLTERQRDVLRLVCSGWNYKSVAAELVIAESTVKAHMGNIYKKLGLNLLPPPQRTKTIFEVFCPGLETAPPAPEIGTDEPEPVTETIEKMVEEDEVALVPWRPQPLVPVEPIVIETRPTRPRRLRWMIFGMILGVLLMALLFAAFRDMFVREVTRVEQVTTSPLVVVVENTVMVTTTPGPALPTFTSIIQEVFVEITTTPQPTFTATTTLTGTPTLTEVVNTPPDSVLEVGEWWKKDGVWLMVSEVEFGNLGELRIHLELWNQTGNDLIFSWSPVGNFSMVDNIGHRYALEYYYTSGINSEVIEAGALVELNHTHYGSPAVKFDDTQYFDPLVTDLYFTVIDLSRVTYAQWHIVVPK